MFKIVKRFKIAYSENLARAQRFSEFIIMTVVIWHLREGKFSSLPLKERQV